MCIYIYTLELFAELIELFAELTEFAPKLSEFSFPQTVLSKKHSARFLGGGGAKKIKGLRVFNPTSLS